MLAKPCQIAMPVLPAGDCQVVIQKFKNRLAIAGATIFDRRWVATVGLRYLLVTYIFYNLLCPTAKGDVLRMNLSLNTTLK